MDGIVGSERLSEIVKGRVERARYYDNNLIIRYEGDENWYWVVNEAGERISRDYREKILEKAGAGNQEVIDFLLDLAKEEEE